MSGARWSAFDHQVWQSLLRCGLQDAQMFYLAVSGGIDSMVLAHTFSKILSVEKLKILHFHHGDTEQIELGSYRDEAMQMLQQYSAAKNIQMIVQKSEVTLKSENDMRNARRAFLMKEILPGGVLVTAHHLDDRLETMLLKLLRGVGADRFNSFVEWDSKVFRPLLFAPKVELLRYAREESLTWLEDPSNQQDYYLRNWLRQNWLQDLEATYPGGVKNLARSLFKLADRLNEQPQFELVCLKTESGHGINRTWYNSLSKSDQNRAIFLLLKQVGIEQVTQGQIEEIRKRLDKNQKEYIFKLLGRKWVINALQIMLE